jgi:hypothetical protein
VLSLLQDLDDLLRRKLADLHRCPPIPRKTLTYQPASLQGHINGRSGSLLTGMLKKCYDFGPLDYLGYAIWVEIPYQGYVDE